MKLRVTLLAMLSCVAFVPAYATDLQIGDVPTLHVAYGDLNVQSDHGAKLLYKRIVAAAAQVCPLYHHGDLAAASHAKDCRKLAIDRAVSEVNQPRLAALHAGRVTG